MILTLIRHGEMTGDPFVRPARPVKGCLTESAGIPQAEATRDALAARRFDVVLSSTYGRALQTAEIVFGSRGIPITACEYLREWDPTDEVKALREPEFLQRMAAAAKLYVDETWRTDLGEGRLDLYARIVPPFLAELGRLGIHARHGGWVPDPGAEGLSVAVVAHGGSLGILLDFLLGRALVPWGGFGFAHTGTAVLRFSAHRGVYHPQLFIPALHDRSEEAWA
jgi:broad specificity phosphatase PhoE